MSVYASWPAPCEDHPSTCAVYVETSPGVFDWSGKPCDCGLVDAPIVYQGSHVMPSDDDPRGGGVDIASIPAFVRNGADPDAEGWLPWLRFGINEGVVILDRRGVELVHRSLGEWLAGLPAARGDGPVPREFLEECRHLSMDGTDNPYVWVCNFCGARIHEIRATGELVPESGEKDVTVYIREDRCEIPYGFRWGPFDVERLAHIEGRGYVICIRTDHGSMQISVSEKGRVIRAYEPEKHYRRVVTTRGDGPVTGGGTGRRV